MSASNRVLHAVLLVIAGAAAIGAPATAADAAALRGYNAPITESSVSGVSSGAFMAVQLATAWSSVIKGVGVVAGGPYWCAKADATDIINGYTLPVLTATGPCMKGPPADVGTFIKKAVEKAQSGDIDPTDNLRRQKVYLFHGYNDAVVAKSVTDAAAEYYQHFLGDAARGNLYYQAALGAGHSLVVLDEPHQRSLNGCRDNESPYIDRCGYDQAGIILQHIYGALAPPNRGKLNGSVRGFDQSKYTPDEPALLSLGDTGYVFVPKDCEDGGSCRVHIALHGCKQDAGDIARKYVDDTGYNAWADTNHIIVLYPQTRASSYLPLNPEACWDWWSYVTHDDDYVAKQGKQISSIKAMLDTLTANAATATNPTSAGGTVPTSLVVTDTSDTAAALAWAPVAGAEGYRVARADAGGAFAAAGTVTGPSFGDGGLTPRSSYRWRVTAVIAGREGAPSAEVAATTRATPPACDAPGRCPIGPAGAH